MKKRNTIFWSSIAVLSFMLFEGCASVPVARASFTMPPQKIAAKDLRKVSKLRIKVTATVTENGIAKEAPRLANYLKGRISSRLCQEGYYRIVDELWGDTDGVVKAYKIASVGDSAHGYPAFTTDSIADAAVLNVDFQAQIHGSMLSQEKEIELKTIPYIRKDKRAGDLVIPFSIPDVKNITISKIMMPENIYKSQGICKLVASISTAEGDIIYKSDELNGKWEEQGHVSKATDTEFAARMCIPIVETLIGDISPVKVSRELPVNDKGDKRSAMLLRANAFADAIVRLEACVNAAKPDKSKLNANYENLGIAYEVIGEFDLAQSCYEKANCQSGLKRIDELKKAKKANKKVKKVNEGFKADKANGGFNLNN